MALIGTPITFSTWNSRASGRPLSSKRGSKLPGEHLTLIEIPDLQVSVIAVERNVDHVIDMLVGLDRECSAVVTSGRS